MKNNRFSSKILENQRVFCTCYLEQELQAQAVSATAGEAAARRDALVAAAVREGRDRHHADRGIPLWEITKIHDFPLNLNEN